MFVGIESYLDESTVRDGTDIFVGDAYDEVTDAVSVYISGIDCVSETVTGFGSSWPSGTVLVEQSVVISACS